LEYWKLRNEENFLFLFYEDMKEDLRSVVMKTIKFFNKQYTEEQIDALVKHLSFDSMKDNPACNKQFFVDYCKNVIENSTQSEQYSFIRNGKVGGHVKEFTSEIDAKFENAFFNNPSARNNELFFRSK
jgi:hypothetical protein